MRSRALIAFALLGSAVAGALAGCATEKSSCAQSFSWAAPVFQCGGSSGGSTIAAKPPGPDTEPGPGPGPGPGTGTEPGPGPGPGSRPGTATPPPPPEPPPPPPEPSPTAKIASGRVDLSETIEFEADSAQLTSRSKQLLDDVARELSDHPEFKRIVVEDYTEVGKRHNMKLSQQRGAAVKSYLVSKGVAGKRLTVKPFGDTKGKGKDPRVEFRVYKK
jgi:outer membrane protein OmpA-like peptidoglycan-associated protein